MKPKSPYQTKQDIPLHCFSNKECTQTPSPELRKYLRYMLDTHPNDLEYLWRYTQQYTAHGGCYKMVFAAWLKKLTTDLTKQEQEK